MDPSPISAQLAEAKTLAITRFEAVNQIDPEEIFDNLQDASKAFMSCINLSMQLTDSYITLQRIYHEWETLVDDLSKSENEEEQQRFQQEQQKLIAELEGENGFPAFYAQLTLAQAKMNQAIQNAVQQRQQFFQSRIHATIITAETSRKFPTDALKWMKTNAKPLMSLKLMQICKFFQHKEFPFFVLPKLNNEEAVKCYYFLLPSSIHRRIHITETLDIFKFGI